MPIDTKSLILNQREMKKEIEKREEGERERERDRKSIDLWSTVQHHSKDSQIDRQQKKIDRQMARQIDIKLESGLRQRDSDK